MYTILIFVAVLGLLVFVHELGHFISAKRLGVRVDEFGFGFPPRLFGIRRGGTLYSINWIPLGGFVRIKGEGGEERADSDSFAHKSATQRIFILSAGVLMNFALAAVLFIGGFLIGIPQEVDQDAIASGRARDVRVVIAEIAPNSPASRSELRVGDSVLAVDGNAFSSPDEVTSYIQEHTGNELAVQIRRGSQVIELSLTAELFDGNDRPLIGIGMLQTGIVRYPFHEAISNGLRATWNITVLVVTSLAALLIGAISGAGVSDQLSGPLGVAVLTGQVAQLGIPYLINFTAMLSINLGILNILPFPALDGGRVIFVLLEAIKGRPISQKIEGLTHSIGFGLLLCLVALVTYRDVLRYGSSIVQGLQGLF